MQSVITNKVRIGLYILGFSAFASSHRMIMIMPRYAEASTHYPHEIIACACALLLFFIALKLPRIKASVYLVCGSALYLFGWLGVAGIATDLTGIDLSYSATLVDVGRIICYSAWLIVFAKEDLRLGLSVLIVSLSIASFSRLFLLGISQDGTNSYYSIFLFLISFVCCLIVVMMPCGVQKNLTDTEPTNTSIAIFLKDFYQHGYVLPFILRIPAIFASSLLVYFVAASSPNPYYVDVTLALGSTAGGIALFVLWSKRGVLFKSGNPLITSATVISAGFALFLIGSSSTYLQLGSIALIEAYSLIIAVISLAVCIEGAQIRIASAAALSSLSLALRHLVGDAGPATWDYAAELRGDSLETLAIVSMALIALILISSYAYKALLRHKQPAAISFIESDLVPSDTTLDATENTPDASTVDTQAEESFSNQFMLSTREIEVLSLLARGTTAPYIAKAFFISENTVRYHIKNIYKKTGVHKRSELLELFENFESSQADPKTKN